jgi:SAM-dependent methyltransferase
MPGAPKAVVASEVPTPVRSGVPAEVLDLPEGRADLRGHIEGLARSHEDDFRASSIAGRLMRHSRGGRVLDAGCGSGSLSLRLHRGGRSVVSVDAGAPMVEVTRRTLSEAGFERADVRRLPLERLEELGLGTFDEFFCCDVIEHVEDDLLALCRLRAALAPGGRLILTVPAHPFLFGERDRRMGHYRRYTRAALVSVFERAGFAIRSVRWWNLSGFLLNAAGSRLKPAGFCEGFRYGERSRAGRLGHWLLNRWFHLFENHVPVPVGLTLIVVADERPRGVSRES